MLPPIGSFHNAAPMDASVLTGRLFGLHLSASGLHEHLLSVMSKRIPPTNGFSDSGDPVGIVSRKITSVDRPFDWSKSFHHSKK